MNPNTPMYSTKNTWLPIAIISMIVGVLAIIGLIWALLNYFDQKDNVDTKISSAVSTAKKEQGDSDQAKFDEEYKNPLREFAGPEDYGSLSFKYPKTWSAFVNKDASDGGNYEAYLNPVAVPPIKATQQFALRISIETKDYDQVIKGYEALVKKGDLSSSAVVASGVNGTRLDGTFSKDIRGAAVIFKIRDKTVTIRSDADIFKDDFNALVATIAFNQ